MEKRRKKSRPLQKLLLPREYVSKERQLKIIISKKGLARTAQNLVNRNKNSLFKKRHYVAIIKYTTEYLTILDIGYKRNPFLFGSTNKEQCLEAADL